MPCCRRAGSAARPCTTGISALSLGIRSAKDGEDHVRHIQGRHLPAGAPGRRLREPASTEVYGQDSRYAQTGRERIAGDDRCRKGRADLRMPRQTRFRQRIRIGVRGSGSRSLRRKWKQDRPTLCRPTLGIDRWQQDPGTLKERAEAPVPDAIPWLLLAAKSVGSEGSFSKVTSVQRVNTVGGGAPKAGCSQAVVGTPARIDYTADYYFFTTK